MDDRLRLKGGGHGQANLDLLDKYHIKYEINDPQYSNGVRVGNIPNHKIKTKQFGKNQVWFPEKWTDNDIRRAEEHVIRLKNNIRSHANPQFAWYNRVKVGIFTCQERVISIFPDKYQKEK
ncbi:MAG: EndoU domain-containing protein [Abditibacteriota bacterium]|nr:EndoU domain-containing protein [Abditibacteriota bacterium]